MIWATHAVAQEAGFDTSVLSDNGREAFEVLVEVDNFAVGPIGFSGVTSDGELAPDVLVRESESVKALRYLVGHATPEGGLYALLGLKIVKCDCFDTEYQRFRRLPETPSRKGSYGRLNAGNVGRMSGCIVFQEKRLKVAKEIAAEKEMIKWKLYYSPNRPE